MQHANKRGPAGFRHPSRQIGDLAGLSTPEDTAAQRFPVVICEGCGPIQVDYNGHRVSSPDQD